MFYLWDLFHTHDDYDGDDGDDGDDDDGDDEYDAQDDEFPKPYTLQNGLPLGQDQGDIRPGIFHHAYCSS